MLYMYNADVYTYVRKNHTEQTSMVSSMYVIRRTREITHLPLAEHFSKNLQNYGVLLVA